MSDKIQILLIVSDDKNNISFRYINIDLFMRLPSLVVFIILSFFVAESARTNNFACLGEFLRRFFHTILTLAIFSLLIIALDF